MAAYLNRAFSENTLNQSISKRMRFDATAHGMRSVFNTLANEFGFNPDSIEVHLAHMENNTVRRAYNRTKYWNERVIIAQQ
jgi:integrase